MAERLLKGRNEEGSFETGVRKVFYISRDSRFVPVNGQGSDGSRLRWMHDAFEQRWYRDNSPFAGVSSEGFFVLVQA